MIETTHYYLIDLENVSLHGLYGMNMPGEGSEIRIFLSNAAHVGTLEVQRDILDSSASIETTFCSVQRKNALDFQLSSYLGYLIGTNAGWQYDYYIVSKDNGFDILASFWNEQNVKVREVPGISIQKREAMEKELTEKVEAALGSSEDAATVTKIITSYKTKQGINNALQKKFPDRVKEIYRAIKPLITDKKGVKED